MYRIWMVVFASIALAEAALAGWSTNAWPSDERWQGSVTVTQLWARWETAIVTNFEGTNVLGVYTQTYATSILSATNPPNPFQGWALTDYTPTNLCLDVRELRALEAFLSAQERGEFMALLRNRIGPNPAHFYRSERETLVSLKSWLNQAIDPDLDILWANRALAESNGGNFAGVTNLFEWESLHDLLAWAGAPSNYCEYTPWRALNGGGLQYPRVTNETFLVQSNSIAGPPYTNAVRDMWGQALAITGDAGEVVVMVVTNTAIEDGRTTADYGWRPWTNVMAALDWPLGWDVYDNGTDAQEDFNSVVPGFTPLRHDFTVDFYRRYPLTAAAALDGSGAGVAGDNQAIATRTTPISFIEYRNFVYHPAWDYP
jgi:hypothetical protein